MINLNLDLIKPRFEEYLEKIEQIETDARALEVVDDETRELAANIAGGAKKMIKAIDARTKEIIAPADSFIKSIRAFASKFTDRLKSAADLAAKKELQYIERLEMARREAEKKAKEAAAKLQAEIDAEAQAKGIEPIKIDAPIIPEPKTTTRTEAGITSYAVTIWDFEIINENEIPREICSPDLKKIREAIRMGIREIKGCKIFEKTEIRHRS